MKAQTPPTVGYIGWHGRGNVGDDAIRDAVDAALPGLSLLDVPLYPRELVASPGHVVRLRRRASGVILGGGTCVGRSNWRFHVRLARTLTGTGPAFAIGVGVEDPTFNGRNSFSEGGELARWSGLLQAFHAVSVRGPRSAELLADVGVEAVVVGDPALLLPPAAVSPQPGRIGINMGFGDDLWGHDPVSTVQAMATACAALADRGYELRGILFNAEDRSWTERALGEVEGGPPDIVQVSDATAAVRELGMCEIAVVSRLHAGILAAVAGTPVVALEYQPKCRDFALSVGAADLMVRTDDLVAGRVLELVEGLLGTREERASGLAVQVSQLRDRLRRSYADLTTVVAPSAVVSS